MHTSPHWCDDDDDDILHDDDEDDGNDDGVDNSTAIFVHMYNDKDMCILADRNLMLPSDEQAMRIYKSI